ncbi:MAG TPA: putative toxin-antitoxin system toxin component, PIN family [Anaerolineales bacterium]|nr:putative toxin-antitoxin system toxin component, PIN family [Anaerolineales bacterium]
MLIVVVLDTNVLVSGLLNPNGSPGKILDLIISNQIQLAYDDRILGEYEEVLSRPELHIRPFQAFAVIGHIELSGKYVIAESLSTDEYPDPDDIMFAEVLIASHANALVTGNLRHYNPLVRRKMSVLSPIRLLEKYFPAPE